MMGKVDGIARNATAALRSPFCWALARRSIRRYGAIQYVDELTEFAAFVKAFSPKTVVEIGTASGGLFWLLCRISAPDATLITLDLPPHIRTFGTVLPDAKQLTSMKRPNQIIYSVLADSHLDETAIQVAGLAKRKIDLLFIDGDHSLHGVSRDYELYRPLVRDGGLIAFHDIATAADYNQVDAFWNTVPNKYKEIRSWVTSSMFGIGICRI